MAFFTTQNDAFDEIMRHGKTACAEFFVYSWLLRNKRFGNDPRYENGIEICKDECFITLNSVLKHMRSSGITKSQIRTALENLEKCGLISCRAVKKDGSNLLSGTIVKIIESHRENVEISSLAGIASNRTGVKSHMMSHRENVEISSIAGIESHKESHTSYKITKDIESVVVSNTYNGAPAEQPAYGSRSNVQMTPAEYDSFCESLSKGGYNAAAFVNDMSVKFDSINHAGIVSLWNRELHKDTYKAAVHAAASITTDESNDDQALKDAINKYGYTPDRWRESCNDVCAMDFGIYGKAIAKALKDIEPLAKQNKYSLLPCDLSKTAICQAVINGDIPADAKMPAFPCAAGEIKAVSLMTRTQSG